MPRRPQSPDYEAVLIYSASASSSKSSPQLGGDQYYPSTSSSSPSSHSSDGSEFCYHEEEEDPDYAAYCTYVDEDEYSANELPEENDDAEEKYVVPLPRAPTKTEDYGVVIVCGVLTYFLVRNYGRMLWERVVWPHIKQQW